MPPSHSTNILLLSALISSTPSSAMANSQPSHQPSQDTPPRPMLKSLSTPHHSEKVSDMPYWSKNPTPAGLDRDLQRGRFWHLSADRPASAHKPPSATVPQGELIDMEDDGPMPDPVNPDERPIPTRYLMQGISKFRDIPSATAGSKLHHGGRRPWFDPSAPSATPRLGIENPNCHMAKGRAMQDEWLDSPAVVALAVLTLMIIAIAMAEICMLIFRRARSEKRPRTGRLRLRGKEKKLQAYRYSTSDAELMEEKEG